MSTSTPLSQAALDAFEGDPAAAGEFLDDLRDVWKDVPFAIGRSITRALVLIAIFELLVRGGIDKASVSGLEITDLSLLRLAIPALVAYHFYDIIAMSLIHLDFEAVHKKVLEIAQPGLAKTGLGYFHQPRQPSVVGASFFNGGPGRLSSFITKTGDVLFLGLLGLLIAFQYYAYTKQLEEFPHTFMIWVALAISVFFTGYGYLTATSRPESSRR
jgi:hypothetical protein